MCLRSARSSLKTPEACTRCYVPKHSPLHYDGFTPCFPLSPRKSASRRCPNPSPRGGAPKRRGTHIIAANIGQHRGFFGGVIRYSKMPFTASAYETDRSKVASPLTRLSKSRWPIAVSRPSGRHAGQVPTVISSPQTGSFEAGVFRRNFLRLGGAEDDEGIEVFRRLEGVCFEVGG